MVRLMVRLMFTETFIVEPSTPWLAIAVAVVAVACAIFTLMMFARATKRWLGAMLAATLVAHFTAFGMFDHHEHTRITDAIGRHSSVERASRHDEGFEELRAINNAGRFYRVDGTPCLVELSRTSVTIICTNRPEGL